MWARHNPCRLLSPVPCIAGVCWVWACPRQLPTRRETRWEGAGRCSCTEHAGTQQLPNKPEKTHPRKRQHTRGHRERQTDGQTPGTDTAAGAQAPRSCPAPPSSFKHPPSSARPAAHTALLGTARHLLQSGTGKSSVPPPLGSERGPPAS